MTKPRGLLKSTAAAAKRYNRFLIGELLIRNGEQMMVLRSKNSLAAVACAHLRYTLSINMDVCRHGGEHRHAS
ncbi:hypothetical protein [Rhizobium sp.]|uniref:hypothetical protein n=1 Tax=Rhizobium sp. TaxID=391 RepID=UPI0034C5F961